MQVTGTIKKVFPVEERGAKNFKVGGFVLTYMNGDKETEGFFEVLGDNNDRLKYKEGDNVTIRFAVACREYKGKYYNNINAWSVRVEAPQSGHPSAPAPEAPAQDNDTGEDLPF